VPKLHTKTLEQVKLNRKDKQKNKLKWRLLRFVFEEMATEKDTGRATHKRD
jgi:hypothetical protein